MISKTTRDFWKLFQRLPKMTQWQAVTTYRSWRNHPFHRSLQFKRIGIKVAGLFRPNWCQLACFRAT